MKRFYLEGNKGGDYLALEVQPDGRVFIEVGHCCVVYVRKIVPVEILTSVLATALTNPDPTKWELDWDSTFQDSDYADGLRGKVSAPSHPFWVEEMLAREKQEQKMTATPKQRIKK